MKVQIARGRHVLGAWEAEEIAEHLESESFFREDDLMWSEGWENWVPLNKGIPKLASVYRKALQTKARGTSPSISQVGYYLFLGGDSAQIPDREKMSLVIDELKSRRSAAVQSTRVGYITMRSVQEDEHKLRSCKIAAVARKVRAKIIELQIQDSRSLLEYLPDELKQLNDWIDSEQKDELAEAKSDVSESKRERIDFWKATFSQARAEEEGGVAMALYSRYGKFTKMPKVAWLKELIAKLDQEAPDWDLTNPELLYKWAAVAP